MDRINNLETRLAREEQQKSDFIGKVTPLLFSQSISIFKVVKIREFPQTNPIHAQKPTIPGIRRAPTNEGASTE